MNALQSAAKRGDADFVKRRLEEVTTLDLNIADIVTAHNDLNPFGMKFRDPCNVSGLFLAPVDSH